MTESHPQSARIRPALAWLATILLLAACSGQAADPVIEERTDKPLADVLFDLEFAASERNFVITGRTFMGEALKDRGVDDAGNATVVQMCELGLVAELLAADPGLIRYMPCRVAAYKEEGQVVVTTLLIPEDSGNAAADDAAARLNAAMREIIREAVMP